MFRIKNVYLIVTIGGVGSRGGGGVGSFGGGGVASFGGGVTSCININMNSYSCFRLTDSVETKEKK